MHDDQTIFAPASAAGKGGVAVFRVSGAEATNILTELARPSGILEPRVATLREIVNPKTRDIVDRALIIYFPAPHSFTGEDVVEVHTHGGRAVMNAMIEALAALPRFRMAEPGEFTRRAFENGKMDLTEAEAIADLVQAETEAQRKQALRQLNGALGRLYEDWRNLLSRSLAMMEAAIDFSEDELPEGLAEKQMAELGRLKDEIAVHLNDNRRGERLREGFSIVILGPPNAGKSSLLNALAQRDAAIVSSTAGTTRDVIEVHLDIAGYPVVLADTAGLREGKPADAIEDEGIRRAHARAAEADLKIVVFDGSVWPQKDASAQKQADENAIVIVNKADLLGESAKSSAQALPVSALTGEGMDDLLGTIRREIENRFADTQTPPLTRARHRQMLEECGQHLDRALGAPQADMRAEDVRLAMRALGRVTGRVDVEDLLDMIFRDFCIGK